MNAEVYRDEEMYTEVEPNVISIKRNPYLMDYEQQRGQRSYGEQRMPQREGARRPSQRVRRESLEGQEIQREQEMRSVPRRMPQQEQGKERGSQRMPQQGQEVRSVSRRMPQQGQEMRRVPQRMSQQGQEMRKAPRRMSQGGQGEQRIQRLPQRGQEVRRPSQQGQEMRRVSQRMRQKQYSSQMGPSARGNIGRYQEDTLSQARNRRALIEKKRAILRRRRIVRMQKMVLFAGIFCIMLLCGMLCLKRMDVKADEPGNKDFQPPITDDTLPATSLFGMVQGLPAAEFTKHPEWEEKFLTPNEYSRPGEALEEVNSIFVHYTANPNTSAAQNRSYFEQLKDTHITSASAHFIIGYNGEIIQCIPLDEIAYAVQTRNYDSVSIECCYKSADGSFTQETYDSLVKLLAWLTDAYDLTTEDILRHYDCGGKKCPIYYTEHEDAWRKLKSDVEEL